MKMSLNIISIYFVLILVFVSFPHYSSKYIRDAIPISSKDKGQVPP